MRSCCFFVFFLFFFLMIRRPPRSTLFPYRRSSDLRPRRPYDPTCPTSFWTTCATTQDRKSTRLNSSHTVTSYAVFCLKKKKSIVINFVAAKHRPRGRVQCTLILVARPVPLAVHRRRRRLHDFPRVFFFFNDTATTEIYTLSLHDALPISAICTEFRGERRWSFMLRRFRLRDRKSTRLNSSHTVISYAVFCLKKKKKN